MDMMPCVCGRPFVPLEDYYHAHVQTGEHRRWVEATNDTPKRRRISHCVKCGRFLSSQRFGICIECWAL